MCLLAVIGILYVVVHGNCTTLQKNTNEINVSENGYIIGIFSSEEANLYKTWHEVMEYCVNERNSSLKVEYRFIEINNHPPEILIRNFSKFVGVISFTSRSLPVAITNFLKQKEIPLFIYTKSRLNVSRTQTGFQRNIPSLDLRLIESLENYNWTGYAVITTEKYKFIAERWERRNIKHCVYFKSVHVDNQSSIFQTVYALQNSKLDVIVLYADEEAAGKFFRVANELKLYNKTFVASSGWSESGFQNTYHKVLKGMVKLTKTFEIPAKFKSSNYSLTDVYNCMVVFKANMHGLNITNNQSKQSSLNISSIRRRNLKYYDFLIENTGLSIPHNKSIRCKCFCAMGSACRLKNDRIPLSSGWEYNIECPQSYHKDIFHFDNYKAYLAYILIFFGILTSLLFISIFVKFGNTPIVRASNKHISILQLIAHAIFFLTTLIFFGEPQKSICISRAIMFGILLTFIMAVTMIKTQKLVFIFQAQILVTRREAHMSKTMEAILVALMICIQLGIAIVSLTLKKSFIEDIKDQKQARHIVACGIGRSFFIQLLFGFLLMLMCMMQAFRARKLPENFNEAKFIAVAMFSSSAAVAIILPMRLTFAKTNEAIVTADLFMLLAINSIQLVVMYGYKCWVIVFHPERNTEFAFRQNLRIHVWNDVDQTISRAVTLSTLCADNRVEESTRTATMRVHMSTSTT